MLFPLWAKLGLLFGTLIGATTVGYGALTVRNRAAVDADRLEKEMLAVGAAVAVSIDGDTFDSFQREDDRRRASFQQVVRVLHSVVEQAPSVTWGGTCRRDDDGNWHQVVEHVNENAYSVGFPIFDGIAERNQALDSGRITYVPSLEDESGRWRTVLVPIKTTSERVVGLVELVADTDRDELIAREALLDVVQQAALAGSLGVALAFLFGGLVAGNLQQLARAAHQVSEGDYDVRVDIRTRDELGLLAGAFNQMVAGLAEREFIRDTFGRFVNPDVVAGILEDRDLSLGGEAREVTVLMSDLRGFTALSAELGPEGMVSLLNRYLTAMTDVVDAHGGNVAELLGDGMVVLFGAPLARDDDPERAIACGLAMLQALDGFNAREGRTLQMGIGVHTGNVIAGTIGSPQHMKYGVVGDAINLAARLESYTVGNQLLVSDTTAERVPGARLGPPQSFQPKGRRDPLGCRVVLGLGALEAPLPDDDRHPCDHDAQLWRIEGKAVAPRAEAVRVVALGRETAVLEGAPLQRGEKVRLALELPDGRLDDLYGTVAQLQPTVLQLTGLSESARAALARHHA